MFISRNALIDTRVPATTYYFVPGTTSSTCHAFQRVVVEGGLSGPTTGGSGPHGTNTGGPCPMTGISGP